MEPKKPHRYQGGKVRQIRQDLTGLITMLILLLVITALMLGCVVARKTVDPTSPAPSSEALSSDGSQEGESSEKPSSGEPDAGTIRYLQLTSADLSKGDLILVNRTRSYDPSKAENLTTVRDGRITNIQENKWAIPIGETMLDALEAMQGDMLKVMQDKMVLLVNAGYRTAKEQQELVDFYTEQNGAEYVFLYVAPVGGSEHHCGLAADVSFYDLNTKKSYATTSDTVAAHYSWILANCYRYGLVLRYTADKTEVTGYGAESWHYRYVGIPHAAYMTTNNLALEEYLEALKDYSFSNRLTVTVDEKAWEIYYVAATGDSADGSTTLPVPKTGHYEISGNNYDGFIVTVDVK